MEKTLVAVFESNTEAKQAQIKLQQAGFSQSDVTLQSTGAGASMAPTNQPLREEDEGGISGFFRSLFGDPDDARAGEYSEAMRRGNCMLTVRAGSDDQADKAADILDDCGAIDIDERAEQWRSDGWKPPVAAGRPPMTSTGDDTKKLAVMQEELQVGKRSVQKGGVRVFTKVTDTPVEETISLRDETVSVQRNPVNREATQADLAAMKGGTIEMRETNEEAVVSKSARVTEEIELNKKTTDRDKTVRDTVRHTDVQVEDLKETAPMASDPKQQPPKRPM